MPTKLSAFLQKISERYKRYLGGTTDYVYVQVRQTLALRQGDMGSVARGIELSARLMEVSRHDGDTMKDLIGFSETESAQIVKWLEALETASSESRANVVAAQLAEALEAYMGVESDHLQVALLAPFRERWAD